MIHYQSIREQNFSFVDVLSQTFMLFFSHLVFLKPRNRDLMRYCLAEIEKLSAREMK